MTTYQTFVYILKTYKVTERQNMKGQKIVNRLLSGRRDGVVVRASASQSVDLVFILLVQSY